MPKQYSKQNLSIRKLSHLSYRLGLPLDLLEIVSNTSEKYYKIWYKEKPNGKLREICSIKPPLKNIQKAIHRLLIELYLPQCVHGGVKNRSNSTNAAVHCKCSCLLNLDLESYFTNISNVRVYNLFRHQLNCSPDVSRLLTKLCTFKGCVPQGASTSTDIANLVFRETDLSLEILVAERGWSYSRYVDDLTFSGDEITKDDLDLIKSIISGSGFKLNDSKEKLAKRNEKQEVTGLSVKFKRPRLPREKKRIWRKEKHIFKKYESSLLSNEAAEKKRLKINGRSSYSSSVGRTKNKK